MRSRASGVSKARRRPLRGEHIRLLVTAVCVVLSQKRLHSSHEFGAAEDRLRPRQRHGWARHVEPPARALRPVPDRDRGAARISSEPTGRAGRLRRRRPTRRRDAPRRRPPRRPLLRWRHRTPRRSRSAAPASVPDGDRAAGDACRPRRPRSRCVRPSGNRMVGRRTDRRSGGVPAWIPPVRRLGLHDPPHPCLRTSSKVPAR